MRNSAQLLLASFPPFSPKDISGLVGWYDYSSWDTTSKTWTDKSGNGNTAIGGNTTYLTTTSISGNGSSKTIDCISVGWDNGSTFGNILWPAAILPSTYTLFHVCRMGGVNQRFIHGNDQNWLSGYWSGYKYSAYHNGWLNTGVGVDSNWIYSTDQNNLYRGNGTTYATSGAGSPSYARLCINNSAVVGGERSIGNVAEIIVYNSTLSSTDYLRVEDYIKTKYGL